MQGRFGMLNTGSSASALVRLCSSDKFLEERLKEDNILFSFSYVFESFCLDGFGCAFPEDLERGNSSDAQNGGFPFISRVSQVHADLWCMEQKKTELIAYSLGLAASFAVSHVSAIHN